MSDYNGNTFFLTAFDDDMDSIIMPLTMEIAHQSKRNNGIINLYITSPGGKASTCFHILGLIELAKRNNVIVKTIITGLAGSAGSLVAVAGTKGYRYIDKNANHCIHYGNAGFGFSTPRQVERQAEHFLAHFARIKKHYADNTDIPVKILEDNLSDDYWYINAAKCIEYGIADKYIEEFSID